jgi:hypothetical protein
MCGSAGWRVGVRLGVLALLLFSAAPASASHPDHLGEGRDQFFSFHTDGARYAVNVATGNLLIAAKDAPLTPLDPDEYHRRVYNSLDPTTGDHLLGTGWRDNFDIALVSHAAGTFDFVDGTGRMWRFTRQPDGTYRPADGGFGSLTFVAGPPAAWHVRENSTGRAYVFNESSGGLVDQQIDANGVRLRYRRNGVAGHEEVRVQGVGNASFYSPQYGVDTYGPLERGSVGAQDWIYGAGSGLETVQAPDGRLTQYGYDFDTGLLNSVQTRTGWTMTIGYVTFMGARRVSLLRAAKGSTTYSLTLSYGAPSGALCLPTDIAMTTVTDETGRVSRFCTSPQWTTTATDGTVVDRWLDGLGTVVNAKVYYDDPSIEPTIYGEEWGDPQTFTARWLDEDGIATRSPVACASASGVCAEYRERSRDSEFGVSGQDVFVRYRGTSEGDARIEQVGELKEIVDAFAGATPHGSGPIAEVLFDWQTRPPGAGSTYILFDETHSIALGGTAVDGPQGEIDTPRTEEVRLRLVLDATTRLPIRETAFQASDGTLVTRRIWSYNSERLPIAQLPPDFFRVPRPASPLMEKDIEFQDAMALAVQTDTDTKRQYAAGNLGASPTIGSRGFCFAYSQSWRYREAPWPEEALKMAASSGADPISYDMKRTLTHYRLRAPDGACPRRGDPALTVDSTARTSAMASAWRREYGEQGQAVPMPRRLRDDAIAPVRIDGHDRVLRVAQITARRSGVYLESGDTAMVITGRFAPDDAQDLVSELKGGAR